MKNIFRECLFSTILVYLTGCVSPQVRPMKGIDAHVSELVTLKTKEGVLGYEDSKTGSKTILCIPGMGDTRGQFRALAPLLLQAGYRVIVLDPRGQGDSDATFEAYTARKVGEDVVSLIDELKLEPMIIGNSSGAASAAWAAAERPSRVRGLILLDGFLRDHPMGFFQRLGLNVALMDPWGRASWISYYKSLFTSNPPPDQETYTEALSQSLKQKDHMQALRQIAFASKSDVEARLKEIKTPVLSLAGSKDPDFENPGAELEWIRSQVGGENALIEGAGHYPHLEYPKDVLTRVQAFLEKNRFNLD